MNEIIKIDFTSKIVPVKPINDQFTLCKCYVMATGKNDNKSIISKDAVDDALPSLFNIPVVGHLYVDEDGTARMGGHDVAIEKDEDGKYNFVTITIPYGTVPVQDNVHYEEVEENGQKKTYLVADIILWTGRYPELLEAKYNEDIFFAQSMEILPSETKKTKEGLDIRKFQFSALCLLGKSDSKEKNVVPCFKSARVEPYEFTEGKSWAELFREFKEQLTISYSAVDVVKGGKMDTETINKIKVECGLAEDAVLSFEVVEGMTEDELRAKIKETYSADEGQEDAAAAEAPAEEPVAEPETEPAAEPAAEEFEEAPAADEGAVEEPVAEPAEPAKFALELTYEEKRKVLFEALSSHEVWNETSYIGYCLIDFDDKYVYSCYHYAGVGIAEESGTIRIPYTIVDDKAMLEMSNNEKVRQVWLTKADEDKLAADSAMLAELAEYKKCREEDDKKKAYSAVIADFSDLGEIDDYKAVVKDAMSFESVEALTEKLYAIRGKYAKKPAKKTLDNIRIPVGFEQTKSKQTEEDEFMSRYLPAKK